MTDYEKLDLKTLKKIYNLYKRLESLGEELDPNQTESLVAWIGRKQAEDDDLFKQKLIKFQQMKKL